MINIFARPSFVGNRFHRWSDKLQTQRISSRVRAEEMALFLGNECQLNPDVLNVKPGDINIHVKPESLITVGQCDYVDFLDGGEFFEELKARPDIKIIACTQNSQDVLRAALPNEVLLIPHHHLNFERRERTRSGVSVCGYLGSYSPKTERHYRWVQEQFDKKGLEVTVLTNFEYKTREDAVNTYLNMDILIIDDYWVPDTNPHKVPTKIINAASFGVPTIARTRNGYQEIEGRYLKMRNFDDLIEKVIYLKENQLFYNDFSKMIKENAEQYHIENIAKLYRQLT